MVSGCLLKLWSVTFFMTHTWGTQTYLHLQVMHWVLVGIIGFVTGIVAFLINICVGYLFQLKFSQFEKGKHTAALVALTTLE